MRKTLTRLLVAALAVTGLISAMPTTSGANPIQELLIDLQVDIVSKPTTVSPAGAPAVFEVTVTNTGGLPTTSALLTVDLAADTAYLDAYSTNACAAAGADATCPVGALEPLQSQRFDVVANTPIQDGQFVITTSATVSDVQLITGSGAELTEALENGDNNTDDVDTTVLTDPKKKAGFLAEGKSMRLDLADGRDFTIAVPLGVPGVIVTELKGSDQATTPRTCLNGVTPATCGNGFTIDYAPHPIYQAMDPNNPLVATMGLGNVDPCRGYGGTCFPTMFTADNSNMTALHNAPYCQGAGPANAPAGNGKLVQRVDGYYEMCVNDEIKGGSEFVFSMRMRSIDPPGIPGLDDLRL